MTERRLLMEWRKSMYEIETGWEHAWRAAAKARIDGVGQEPVELPPEPHAP
jgi:hypothetical protein